MVSLSLSGLQQSLQEHVQDLASNVAQSDGDVIGKVTTGYQAWFTCHGDNSPIGGWWHWAPDRMKSPSKTNAGINSWPAMQYYEKKYATDYPKLEGGAPSTLFSNFDESTCLAQFKQMKDAQIDTAALQRFNPTGGEGPIRDAITPFVNKAAETTGLKWYCMYDISGWKNMAKEMPNDWTTKMSAYTKSKAYARQGGKPVVCVWGFGFNDDNHVWDPKECIQVIQWFKQQGCFVIGGVPTWWRRGSQDSRNNYAEVYQSLDMVSPWMVGRASKPADLDNYYSDANVPDQDELAKHGQAYQPCVMPGDLRSGDRLHGDFYWRHLYNASRLAQRFRKGQSKAPVGIYISMFDEFNEGNQIAPTAENKSQQPPGFPFGALDEDGTPCTADYYLRLTKDGGAMFKGKTPMKKLRYTEPVPGNGAVVKDPLLNMCFKACVNGKFVTAESGGNKPLIGNRDKPGPWERYTFTYVDGKGDDADGPRKITIKAHANNKYVSADANAKDGAFALIANADKAGPAETFEMSSSGGSNVSFKAVNGLFVQASNSGSGQLFASVQNPGWWEQFELVENA